MQEVLKDTATTEYSIDISQSGTPPGRNFFILLDGTWNEERGKGGDFRPSNVRKLYDALQSDSRMQIARYFRGIGSSQDNSRLTSWWYGFNGEDEKRIRKSALATINKEYKPGDELFILGFSRGAACARRLARDLSTSGICDSIRVHTRMVANRMTDQVETRFERLEWKGNGSSIPIRFLGCWDTVGAFVLPLRFPNSPRLDWMIRKWVALRETLSGNVPFQNLSVANNVKRAVHCVALDETRNAFLPSLMNWDDRVEEVWFPGVHSDVGGGYTHDGLARISLDFMVKRLDQYVAQEKLEPIKWRDQQLGQAMQYDTKSLFHFHFHGLTRGFKLNGKSIRRIGVMRDNKPDPDIKPRIHWSVAELWQSPLVFAENAKSKNSWRIDYRPFNVHELNQTHGHLRANKDDWPFEWVERPSGAYV
jgi:hypothetical protein